MSAPPANRITELAPHKERVAAHEAGHVVGAALLNLPLHQATLSYERRFLRWAVVGQTLIAPPGQTIDVDETDDLLFTVAGLAAEAIWLGLQDGYTFDSAWQAAETNPVNQAGDLREIAACLPYANLSYAQAQAQVDNELCAAWDSVVAVAEQLCQTGHLTARQLARLV